MAVKFLENCLKKDSTTDTNLTGIFYNNLAGVYLTLGKYEKAFKYTKKSLYLLEPEVFYFYLFLFAQFPLDFPSCSRNSFKTA